MNQTKVSKNLNQIFKMSEDKGTCVFIDGGWGIGKTHSILNQFKDNGEEISLKYISVFGKKDLEQIEKELLLQLMPMEKLFNKVKDNSSMRILGNVVTSALKLFDKEVNILDLLNNLRIENISYDRKKENIVLCIDDLERKSTNIEMGDLLGLIERASTNFNIVIIANSTKLSEDDLECFNEYKEKIVDYHFIIDELDIGTMQQIAENRLRDLNEENIKMVSDFYFENIENYCLMKKGEDESNYEILKNFRIYNKYINLVQRVGEVVNKEFPDSQFEFDKDSLECCIGVIVESFLFNSAGEKRHKPKTHIKMMMHESIKLILHYEDYNPKIHILKDYLILKSEIAKDIHRLYSAYKLNKSELENLLSKVQKRIDRQTIEYFKEPNLVVSLFDALNILEDDYPNEKELLDIAIKLYKPSIDEKVLELRAEDWDNFDAINEIDCNQRTRIFIEKLNSNVLNKYEGFLNDEYNEALAEKNINSLHQIIQLRSFTDLEGFQKVFDLFFDEAVTFFEETKWGYICSLVIKGSENKEIGVYKFLMERVNSDIACATKLKYKKLIEVLQEEEYFRSEAEYHFEEK